MPSYTSALNLLAASIRLLIEKKLKSKKKYYVHCVSIQDTYIRLFITKFGVNSTPFSQHTGVRFIEITQARHDQDKWTVGFGHDLAKDEAFKMVGYHYPKNAIAAVAIAKHVNTFFSTGQYPVVSGGSQAVH
jgi:UDP-N-acetylmuramate-alanine ligase